MGNGIRTGAGGAAILGFALLAAGCADASDGWLDDADAYDAGYEDGYADGSYDDPTLGEILIGGAFTAAFGGGDDDDDGPPVYAVNWEKGRSDLVRGDGAGGLAARGVVAIRSSRRREEFAVSLRDGPPGAVLEVVLVDRDGGEFTAGSLLVDYRGEAGLRLRSDSRDRLPAAATSVEGLAGAGVEVRDGFGAAILRGRVPALEGRGSRAATSRARDAATGAAARVRLQGSMAAGRRLARVDLAGLPPGAAATLLVEDGAGALAPEATLEAGPDGCGSFRFDSRRGAPLPGGAEDVPELGMRTYRVLVDGEPVIDGMFPPF